MRLTVPFKASSSGVQQRSPVALIVVADEVERQHVVARLEETMERTHARIHTDTGWDVVVAGIAVDTDKPADALEFAVGMTDPRVLLFVGSAASLVGQSDGDVVVGQEVSVLRLVGGSPLLRRISQRAAPPLLRAATAARDTGSWRDSYLLAGGAAPEVVFGRLVAGGQAVSDWRTHGVEAVLGSFPRALALERRGWDFLRDFYGDDDMPALSICGLWTAVDDAPERLVGIDHALAFALDVLRQLPAEEHRSDPLDALADDGEWAHGRGDAETAQSPALTDGFVQRPWTESDLGQQARAGPSLNADRKQGMRRENLEEYLDAGLSGRAPVRPADPIDLTLTIDLLPDGRGLSFELHSETLDDYYRTPVGEIEFAQFGTSPDTYRDSIRTDVRAIAAGTTSGPDLAELGRRLWNELVPPELKREYDRFRERVTTMQITSEEPWIPWELVKPWSDEWGEDDHLCIRFATTRWLRGKQQPRSSFEINAIALIEAGAVEGEEPLVTAHDECLHVSTLAERFSVLNLSPDSVDKRAIDALVRRGQEEQANLWHVAAHGKLGTAPDDAYVVLGDRQRWRAGDMVGPHAQPIRLVRPLVFFNTCLVAEMSFTLTQLGGWPKMWISDCRCGAFLGPRWSVDSGRAYHFARTFYDALVDDGLPLGAAVQHARQVVRSEAPEDPTWAAYTLYGHPNARVRFGSSATAGANGT
jgi:nucleoside phosphorylase